MLYTIENQYPAPLPESIRLSSGLTRTDSTTYTEEEIADAGYIAVEDPPVYNPLTQRLEWENSNSTGEWKLVDIPIDEQWRKYREIRDSLMNQFEWRISRHRREVDLGMIPTEELTPLLQYMQELADITKQADPHNIIWPVPPGYNSLAPYSVPGNN